MNWDTSRKSRPDAEFKVVAILFSPPAAPAPVECRRLGLELAPYGLSDAAGVLVATGEPMRTHEALAA
jgi:hypothetical protein